MMMIFNSILLYDLIIKFVIDEICVIKIIKGSSIRQVSINKLDKVCSNIIEN